MNSTVSNIMSSIHLIKNHAKNFYDSVQKLDSTDINASFYVTKLKKLAAQHLDLLNEAERQAGFLSNINKQNDVRKKFELNRKMQREQYEIRKQKRQGVVK